MPKRLTIVLIAMLAMIFSIHPAMAGAAGPTAKLKLTTATIASGASTTATVTLSATATSSMTFDIETSDDALTAPATVKVAKGKKSATFKVTAGWVSADTSVIVYVSGNGSSSQASLKINPTQVIFLGLSSKSVKSGTPVTATVKLNGPAADGGKTVKVKVTGPISADATVTVPGGKTSVTFTVSTIEVTKSTKATVTATLKSKYSASLTVTPNVVSDVALSPSTIESGGQTTVTVKLGAVAPEGGITVQVTASGFNTNGVTHSVEIEEGSKTGSHTFRAPEGNEATAQITFTAVYLESGDSATLTLNPFVD